MATSAGWGQLGNTIAGGNKLNSELAYDQGQSLGARTADALQQARERIDKNNALEQLDAKLTPYLPDPKERAGAVAAAQAGIPLEQLSGFRQQGFNYGQRQVAADPAATDDARAQALFSIGNNDQVLRPAGANGEFTNTLHPSQGVQMTDIGAKIAQGKALETEASTAEKNTVAEKNRDQIAHPEKYRLVAPNATPGSDGSQPVGQETYAQLVAQGLAPMPTPGRALIQMGGEEFTRRVNYLAGGGGTKPAPAPAPGGQVPAVVPPGAPPAVAAPGAAPAAAPATGDIKLPESPTSPPAFKANFDANAYGQRRTTLNDLARKSGTGGNDDALNRTAGHLDVYEQLMKESGNSNFQASNQLKNWFQSQTGKAWPGRADLAAQVLGTEIIKSMTTVGAGGVEERGALKSQFANAKSYDAAQGAIETAQDLLREQAVGTNQRVGASGVKDYYAKYLTSTARRRLKLGEFDLSNGQAPGAPPANPAPADNDPLGIRGK